MKNALPSGNICSVVLPFLTKFCFRRPSIAPPLCRFLRLRWWDPSTRNCAGATAAGQRERTPAGAQAKGRAGGARLLAQPVKLAVGVFARHAGRHKGPENADGDPLARVGAGSVGDTRGGMHQPWRRVRVAHQALAHVPEQGVVERARHEALEREQRRGARAQPGDPEHRVRRLGERRERPVYKWPQLCTELHHLVVAGVHAVRIDADDAREAEAVHVKVEHVEEDERTALVEAPADEKRRRWAHHGQELWR